MKLYEIIKNMKFIGIKNYREIDIDSLTCNSQEKCENSIYFCIKGLKNDGHAFSDKAIKNGAVCLVVEHYLDLSITQILVEDVRATMSYISSIFYETYKSKMKFVGITGTNGKTTTTLLVREILTKMGKRVGLIGTEGVYINNLMLPPVLTTPDPIDLHKLISDCERNGCEYCIMEVSAHAIALHKIDFIHYDVVGLSNITKDHLDFFLSMENYVKCKSSLFDYRHAKCGVINIDAKYGKEIAKRANLDVVTIGKEGEISLINSVKTVSKSKFNFSYKNKTYSCTTNLLGEYNISNVLMAIAILTKLDFEIPDILKTIRSTTFYIPGRFNILDTNTDFSVVVDYAHTPDGIKNILSTIKELPHNRLITVFGCGGDRDKTKRPEMGKVAIDYSDIVIVSSDNPRTENPDLIIDDIVRSLPVNSYYRVTERKTAIEYALSIAKPNDIIAILGKGAENYQDINGVKIPYSDYDVVDNFLKYSNKGKIKL